MRQFALTVALLCGIFFFSGVLAQTTESVEVAENDTLVSEPIIFTPPLASEYIIHILQAEDLWRPDGQYLRLMLKRLTEHYAEAYDSIRSKLETTNLRLEEINIAEVVKNDTLPVLWLNDSTFIINTLPLGKEPFLESEVLVPPPPDTLHFPFTEEDLTLGFPTDTLLERFDTLKVLVIDSVLLAEKKIKLFRFVDGKIKPPLVLEDEVGKTLSFSDDSNALILTETSQVLLAGPESPFYMFPNERMPDSLHVAVQTLLEYTDTRDSVLIHISNLDGRQTPLWLTTKEEEMQRFWVKNYANDSITLWIANPARNAISLILEENVNVERREKRSAANVPISTFRPSSSLSPLKPLAEIPVFWNYGLASSLTVNQTFFSNWSRGGESSLAMNIDIKTSAEYTNKLKKSRWNNEARMRYGSISTDGYKSFRSNTDILELNSQYNSQLRGKFDFSSVLYFKTQVAQGYKNQTDTEVISRFLNPGTFTIGLGVEYKPFAETRINLSPLSYRNTFVLDTAAIDQTLHGIEADKRSRQEMGGQLVIRNKVTVMKNLVVTNNLRLFSGYLNKPKNVDVDWEINIEKQFNYYFMVRLNLHMIYDDDIRFPVEDDAGNPVLLPDGSPRRAPRTQLKQLLGLSMAFRI